MQQYEDWGRYNLGVYKKASLFSEDVCAMFSAGDNDVPGAGWRKPFHNRNAAPKVRE